MRRRSLKVLDEAHRPVRDAVQRLRWFIGSLREQVSQSAEATGIVFKLDEQTATAVFLDWLRAFEGQKPRERQARRAYVGFAAGLMLRALIERNPLSVVETPENGDATNPAFFWPEGYVYVAYCLNIRSAVLEQDFQEDQSIAPELGRLRTWWSFKENIAEDPALSIAFLDLFAGEEPDWTMPGIFRGPDVHRIASTFYEQRSIDGQA